MEVSGRRSDITKEGTADELEKLCEVCEVDGVTTNANGICHECEQFMCGTCFRTHLKTKLCRHHVMIDINKIETTLQIKTENVEKCTSHATETIKYYCRKHETVGCGDCMIPLHGACKPENIKDLSKQFHDSEDFKSLMRNLQDITTANQENDKKVQENKKTNQVMLEKAMEEITKIRSEINDYFDNAEANIIKDAKDIERNNNKLLAKLEQDCQLLSSKITEVRKKLDTEHYQDNTLFIQTVDCKPRVVDIEREVSRIQRENDIRTYEFWPDKRLQDIVTSIKKLGNLGKIENKSTMKPATARLIKEVGRDEIACHEKQREPVKEKKEKGLEHANRSAVGARVRPIEGRTLFEQSQHQAEGVLKMPETAFIKRMMDFEEKTQQEIEELKTENEKLTREKNYCKERVESLEKERSDLLARNQELLETESPQQQSKETLQRHAKQSGRDNQVEKLRKQCRQMENDKLELLEQRNALEVQKDTLETHVNHLKEEKDELLLQLSKFYRDSLVCNNPPNTELSDPHRPTKFAEYYSELYDIEWTSAFEALDEGGYDEETAIEILRLTLQNVLQFCEDKADLLLQKASDVVLEMRMPSHLRKPKQQTRDVAQYHRREKSSLEDIKLQRMWEPYSNKSIAGAKTSCEKVQKEEHSKLNAENKLKQLRKDMASTMVPIVQKAYIEASWTNRCIEELKPYILKCLYLGWMMVVQSPPMVLHKCPSEKETKFDKNFYKEYTASGPLVSYIVWPALLLKENGPLVCKGVAQGKKS